jgi:hypothetical protein
VQSNAAEDEAQARQRRAVFHTRAELDYFGNRVARYEGFDMALKAVGLGLLHAFPFIVMARKLRAPVLRYAIRDAEARAANVSAGT